MAITRAQQVRQMYKKGSKKPAMQGGGPNYLGKQPEVTVPKKWKSSPDHPDTELAYITEPEKQVLIALNMHGGLEDGKPNKGPKGIISLQGDMGSVKSDNRGGYTGTGGGDGTDYSRNDPPSDFRSSNVMNPTTKEARERFEKTGQKVESLTDTGGFTGGYGGSGGSDDPDDQPVKDLLEFYNKPANYPKYTPAYLKFLAELNRKPNRKYFVEKVLRAGKIPGLDYQDIYDEDFDIESAYQNYMDNRMAGKTDAMGNPVAGFQYDDSGNLIGNFIDGGGGDGGMSDYERRLLELENQLKDQQAAAPTTNPYAFRFLADGGRAQAMDGGIMNADMIGGMMDGNMDEMGRQMYGLGKLVKKATRAVKKVAKSPLGKAALLGAVGFGIPGTSLGGIFGRASFGGAAPGLFKFGGIKNALTLGKIKAGNLLFGTPGDMGGRVAGTGLLNFLKNNPGMTIAGLSALPFLFQGQEDEEEFDPYRGPDIDIDKIRLDPYGAMRGAYRNYAEGGKAEPVAKKTMPLIDMDGKEKDYRETGGFVDMGRMERADDVPARLSKNEFVFTADAVRNAGEGDIDKGAEVMYNMMKNLEAGGEISEESQGLEGARKMFQTSQRLGEVI